MPLQHCFPFSLLSLSAQLSVLFILRHCVLPSSLLPSMSLMSLPFADLLVYLCPVQSITQFIDSTSVQLTSHRIFVLGSISIAFLSPFHSSLLSLSLLFSRPSTCTSSWFNSQGLQFLSVNSHGFFPFSHLHVNALRLLPLPPELYCMPLPLSLISIMTVFSIVFPLLVVVSVSFNNALYSPRFCSIYLVFPRVPRSGFFCHWAACQFNSIHSHPSVYPFHFIPFHSTPSRFRFRPSSWKRSVLFSFSGLVTTDSGDSILDAFLYVSPIMNLAATTFFPFCLYMLMAQSCLHRTWDVKTRRICLMYLDAQYLE